MSDLLILAAIAVLQVEVPIDRTFPTKARAEAAVRIQRSAKASAGEWQKAPRRRERIILDQSGRYVLQRLIEFE